MQLTARRSKDGSAIWDLHIREEAPGDGGVNLIQPQTNTMQSVGQSLQMDS